VLVGIGLWYLVPALLFKPVLERAVQSATGLECDFGTGRPLPGRVFQTDRFRLGPAKAPVLEVEEPALGFDRGGVLTKAFVGQKKVVLNRPDWPRLVLKDVYLSYNPGALHLQLDCADLNPLLERHGKVRCEHGRLVLDAPLDLARRDFDCNVSVSLRNIKVRSLDGRFEVQAEEARATVKVTGTVDDPRIDLDQLEPWLGAEFVKAFRKPAP
jgi:hypothetical protein